MGTFIKEVGPVTFIRHPKHYKGGSLVKIVVDAGDVVPGCKEGSIEVRILEDKRVFDAATFAAFCTEENAKKMVDDYVRPLLKWLAERGESAA